MYNIVILDKKTLGFDIDVSKFEQLGEVIAYDNTLPEQVEERISGQDIIVTNKVVLNETNLNNHKVKMICIIATGTNNVDLSYCKKSNIAVTNVAGYSTNSVAQHTFAMLFYLLEHLSYYDDFVKSGKYSENDIFTHLGREYYELMGKTWGIIGLGVIGKKVAKIAQGFGCNIVYYSTSGKNTNNEYKRLELDELLKVSDIVSIHAPLNDDTYNIITYDKLKMMKKSSILINVGRGGIVNEKDLATALDEDIIRGAALDVLEKEPIEKDNPLMKINDKSKIHITPHIAWGSKEARITLINEACLNIQSFINNGTRNRVETSC